MAVGVEHEDGVILHAFHEQAEPLLGVCQLGRASGDPQLKLGGGAAGHNGLRSMDRMLGTPDYWRVRLGIGHPGHKDRVTGHVLGDFAKVDQEWLAELLDAVADQAPLLASNKKEEFMSRVALATGGAA